MPMPYYYYWIFNGGNVWRKGENAKGDDGVRSHACLLLDSY